MLYVWSILLILLNAVWLILVFFALPGNWLIIITTALFAWWQADKGVFSKYTLILIVALAIVGELMEFFGSFAGARRTGASHLASIAALIGAVAGALVGTVVIPIPFLGTLIGACAGAGTAAWSVELMKGTHPKRSIRTGVGAGVGELIGIVSKFGIGCLIWLIIAIAAFWP